MTKSKKLRIAFVKFGGLSAGGTERWLQMMAANLPRNEFEIDYYYCDAAPYIGSDYRHADTDPGRLQYMLDHGVKLVKFEVGAKDVTKLTHDWVNTNFWDVFDSQNYDLVQTAKAGPAEYPYFKIDCPVIEYVTLGAGVDFSSNIVCSLHVSQWQRSRWVRSGGVLERSGVIPIPSEPPATNVDLRSALSIPSDALVAGFHQRGDENIFSPIPVGAFIKLNRPDRHFVIMGGGNAYREQARRVGLRNIHFVEHGSDPKSISAFLNTLDIFAHGRRDGETFGTVFAEAMMHGLPCLSHFSYIANGHVETMGPGGLFAYDADDFEQKLEALFSDDVLRRKLTVKATAHARKYYSLDSCVAQLAGTYTQLLGRDASQGAKAGVSPIPYGWSDMGFLYAGVLEKPSSLGYHVMTGGTPEEFCVHMIRFFLPKVTVFLDIGANTGIYCWVAAKECSEDAVVIAFEPQERCCRYLRKTAEINNWEDRVRIVPMGLGSKTGELNLFECGTGSTFNNSFNDDAKLPSISVPVGTLDEQMEIQKLPGVDFIKIDVEGFEYDVLIGGKQTIAKYKPLLFIEIADGITGRKFRNPNFVATLEWLKERGYRIWKADEIAGRMIEVNSIKPQPHLAMYMCLHKDLHVELVSGMMRHAAAYRAEKRRQRWLPWASRFGRLMRHPIKTLNILLRRAWVAVGCLQP